MDGGAAGGAGRAAARAHGARWRDPQVMNWEMHDRKNGRMVAAAYCYDSNENVVHIGIIMLPVKR